MTPDTFLSHAAHAFTFVNDSMLEMQVAALNDAFKSAGFAFTLSSMNYVLNASW